jgi:hypothetical protein
VDVVIELTQRRRGYLDATKQQKADQLPPDSAKFDGDFKPDFTFRGGCTLLIDSESGSVRYCMKKSVGSDARLARQQAFASGSAAPSLRATYSRPNRNERLREPFAAVHRGF